MPELQIRIPYTAWGDGDEWQGKDDELFGDLCEALATAGADYDDADHQNAYLIFFAIGDDVDALVRVVRPVLDAHGVLARATGFLTDLDANDFTIGTFVTLQY